MVNLITGLAGRPIQNSASSPITDQRRVTAPPVANATESVTLSPELTVAPAALQAGPPIDAAKVAALREGISNGSYKIDPKRIADAIASNLVEISQ